MWYFNSSQQADGIALQSGQTTLTYGQLNQAVASRVSWLQAQQVKRVAIALDNSIEWVLFDLACQQAELCCVPVPGFFIEQQRYHLLNQAAIELLITASDQQKKLSSAQQSPYAGIVFERLTPLHEPQIPHGTSKITFTSGTTAAPKGVCLSTQSQLQVARTLTEAIGLQQVRHLCLLPLATLLENIAGVYAPLMVGGTVILADQQSRGFEGSRLLHPQQLLTLIQQHQPHTLILVPELLRLLVTCCQQGWQAPKSLAFIAVGGGHVASTLIEQARQLGLPVYQGYGLSECASVVALNTAEHNNINSAGRLLPHVQCRIENHELVVSGNVFLGYLNQPDSFYPTEVHTGDLVSIEQDYLHIQGRSKHILINSFGRNISPEWVEAELLASGLLKDVLLFGEGRPGCGVLLSPVTEHISEHQLQQLMTAVNQRLPDYARVTCWLRLSQPLYTIPGLVTATGKPVRERILQHFASQIDDLYAQGVKTRAPETLGVNA